MPKRLLWLMVPVVAVAAPPLVYNAPHWWTEAKQRVAPLLSLAAGTEGGATTGSTPAGTPSSADPATVAASRADPLVPSGERLHRPGDAPMQVDPGDVLRFDVTPAWVMERWPWITAGLSQLPLQGYRVPLVTGTAVDDLAGSLTYYFNARQAVEQITFEGTTGDATRLLRVLIGRYGFGRRLTNDPGLFRYEVPEARGPVKSFLNVRLVQPNDPYRRYQVDLVMQRAE